MTENEIEDVVKENIEKLGYASAYAIRNVRIGPEQGQVDLAMFPRKGKKKVILVEVKRSAAEDAKCKVVGQIIMYLTGALQLSLEGIQLYRDYARREETRVKAIATQKTTAMQVTGAASAKAAWEIVCKGESIRRDQIALYIATDGAPNVQLTKAVNLLSKEYNLHIGLIHVSKSDIQIIKKCP